MALNEEYAEQLTQYRNRLEDIDDDYQEKLQKMKEENINLLNAYNNNSNEYIPEMIPPDQTFKIFMHFLKHFKYEEIMYKKYIEQNDLIYIKSFILKLENTNNNNQNTNREGKVTK